MGDFDECRVERGVGLWGGGGGGHAFVPGSACGRMAKGISSKIRISRVRFCAKLHACNGSWARESTPRVLA